MARVTVDLRVVPVALFAALQLAEPVKAETVDCRPIRRLPAAISAPGIYCLNQDLATEISSGTAVTIDADDVVLDLNARTIDGSAAGLGTDAIGIRAVGRSNVTVRNGTVRGFRVGVQLVDAGASSGHVVEAIRADRNTANGIAAGGRGLRIRANQVLHTGGSTSPLASGRAHGIVVTAPGSVVSGNVIVGTTAAEGSFAYGIHATQSDGLVIEGNQVVNQTPPPAFSFGILVPFSQDVLVVGNRLTNLDEGVTYSSGATGKYRDNLTAGVVAPFNGTGTDAGDNN